METKLKMNSLSAMKLIDVNGVEHPLSDYNVTIILVVGWTSFILAYVFNILYYKVHPSGVDFNFSRFRNKLHFYICGYRIDFNAGEKDKLHKNSIEMEKLVISDV